MYYFIGSLTYQSARDGVTKKIVSPDFAFCKYSFLDYFSYWGDFHDVSLKFLGRETLETFRRSSQNKCASENGEGGGGTDVAYAYVY